MPDGRTHFCIMVLFVPGIAVALWLFVGAREAIVSIAGMVVGDLLLSPDLDHNSGATSYRLWGILRMVWLPYQRMVSHRSFISHGPLIGTAGRLLYLAVLPAIVITINSWWPNVFAWYQDNQRDVIFAVTGIEASSMIHILADRFW